MGSLYGKRRQIEYYGPGVKWPTQLTMPLGSGEYASSNEVVREAFRRIVNAARNLADLF